MNKQQEPRLRFKGFTGTWEEKKLEDIFNTIRNAFVGTATPFYVENGHFYLESNNIKNGEINKKSQIFINDEFYYKQQDKWLKTNDLVMVQSGHVGHCAVIPEELNNVAAHALIIFSNYKLEANPYFLSYQFQTNSKINEIAKITTGNTIKHILSSDMKEFAVDFPMVEEQTHLGLFFRRLDSQITESRAVLEKSRQLKKAMLAKMFPANGEKIPKIRFKGFEGEWESRKLGEMADIVRGASPRPIQDPKWFDDNSDIGWLRISDVTIQNGRIHYLEQKISKAGQGKTRVLEEPHLLLSIAASVGKPVINYVKTGVHDGFLVFKNPNFELEFMFQYLDSFLDTWQCYGQPGTQVNLNSDIVKNADFFIPPNPKEQTAIGNFFCQLDETIALQSAEVEKLNQLKKGLLAAMLV
ncbi:TPA: restriction endonuclease subunit S [Haemophilus influenzae]|uniref:restriction endonuclease subunit S n=1 Tax=Haemophilus influenzae TaxID=727 RepID=UPI000D019F77|nr:restriction endonuclease subunit S [Haemophilus influenzae]AXP37393.1 restriction endonuclease subunit S [Haemophilus influenzae]AXP65935.1 restriction endonuclease subunit S [Haemophilus influenzae]AYO35659.1 restriction endonuclease subunit S [Haemophilus influenzae]MCK8810284.1 restriction endonuclease subunit S [Haemophilus influenzae]MCK9649867.1 restriction endonuclease subunit S [Haemophilus influenzae]